REPLPAKALIYGRFLHRRSAALRRLPGQAATLHAAIFFFGISWTGLEGKFTLTHPFRPGADLQNWRRSRPRASRRWPSAGA
ncbi:MAG: hypothetical protein WA579_02895, partial [Rhodomicrobium sp.]